MTDKMDILSKSLEELSAELASLGAPAFRAKQVFGWLHSNRVKSFDEMTNIPKALRETLSNHFMIDGLKIIETVTSRDGSKKMLYELSDGNIIEGVLIKYRHGYSLCVSTQVGCRMGCTFCASGKDGLLRNLTPAEMLLQLYRVSETIDEKIGNIVLMGSGEPLDNFENVMKFISLATESSGYDLSIRGITLSTAGVVPGIRKLADLKLGLTLAISLHAPYDELRLKTMPIARAYPMEELMDAVRYYISETNRRVTFEYALISGHNDTDEDARKLARLLKGLLVHVNLIPINKVEEKNYMPSSNDSIARFGKILSREGVTVTVRRELGSDINAACGQLKNNFVNFQKK